MTCGQPRTTTLCVGAVKGRPPFLTGRTTLFEWADHPFCEGPNNQYQQPRENNHYAGPPSQKGWSS